MSFTSALAIKRLRTILKFGATVFGLSAVFLLIDPKTFLELLKVGANKLSYDAKIDLFPEGEYKIEDLGKKPIAKVSLHPEKNIQSKLYEFVTKNREFQKIFFKKSKCGYALYV